MFAYMGCARTKDFENGNLNFQGVDPLVAEAEGDPLVGEADTEHTYDRVFRIFPRVFFQIDSPEQL